MRRRDRERRNRGKALNDDSDEVGQNDNDGMEFYYSTSSDLPCKKHPSSSSVGICAYCLKDRLVKLVCSDCGEQRLSSCSCSEISSNRNSCTVEVGSVGRVSFLIENERGENGVSEHGQRQRKTDDEAVFLRRSNSSSVEVKRRNGGFWRLGRIFGRRKEKMRGGFDERSEVWVVDDRSERNAGVSRSRSLCSFRNGNGGGWYFGSEDGGDNAARSSVSGARSSSVTACMVLDSGRRSGFSEVEPRKSDHETSSSVVSEFSGFVSTSYNTNGSGNRRVFSLKESDFGGMDDSGFIDLKLDYSSESKAGFVSDSESGFGSMRAGNDYGLDFGCGNGGFGGVNSGRVFSRGGSCRITVNDRGVKRGRKSLKGWRWIFRNHTGKKDGDQDDMFKT